MDKLTLSRPLPRMHDDREYCLYSNGLGQSIGECALEVRGWLADHPEYQGRIYGDWNTGGSRDHFDATEMFFPDGDDDPRLSVEGEQSEDSPISEEAA